MYGEGPAAPLVHREVREPAHRDEDPDLLAAEKDVLCNRGPLFISSHRRLRLRKVARDPHLHQGVPDIRVRLVVQVQRRGGNLQKSRKTN